MKKILSLIMTKLFSAFGHKAGKRALDGKKVLFAGNSFIYYGRTVDAVSKTELEQSSRIDTKGSFCQLCKANGINVEVTNQTFGAHTLGDIFGGCCSREKDPCFGKDHTAYFTDRSFDYVVFSPASGAKQEAGFAEDTDKLMSFFREANPDVKFICLGNIGAYGYNSYEEEFPGIRAYYKELEKKGVKIADWGALIKDIIDGRLKVPGAVQEYTRNTFVNNKDNYHPNLLTGYITTLFTYCTITGESALGQPYGYYNDASSAPVIDISAYTDYYYVNGNEDTNFPQVFASKSDMRGIQRLIDKSLRRN